MSDLKERVDSELDEQEEQRKESNQNIKENIGNESNQSTEQNEGSGKMCGTKNSDLRSEDSRRTVKIARAYENKIGIEYELQRFQELARIYGVILRKNLVKWNYMLMIMEQYMKWTQEILLLEK
ncbi:hypothetical protein HMPREF1092_01796 [Clostridium thermobutyricum]|uniref:Uncharacterized protein n=1 Tax=Clostridium thermobutyricum TaxID=29372 RepID=N9WHK9_9CLOT|nr:hypothetical protein [Clostridium thermobutyricum]ENZ02561.1 hypothetical protein HMPREF1092_01796 [Clostridium thermobutyricum]